MSNIYAQEALTSLITNTPQPVLSFERGHRKPLLKSVRNYFAAVITTLKRRSEARRHTQKDNQRAEATSVYDIESSMRDLDRRSVC